MQFGHEARQVLVRDKLGDFRRLYSLEHGTLTPISPSFGTTCRACGSITRAAHLLQRRRRWLRWLHVFDAHLRCGRYALPSYPPPNNSVSSALAQRALRRAVVPDSCDAATTGWFTTGSPQAAGVESAIDARQRARSRRRRSNRTRHNGTRSRCSCRGRTFARSRCPVIVEIQGGPKGQATAGPASAHIGKPDAGFTMVSARRRRSEGYSKAWLHADDGPKRLKRRRRHRRLRGVVEMAWADQRSRTAGRHHGAQLGRLLDADGDDVFAAG